MDSFLTILKQAYREEKGAEGLEKLLIVAAIVLPLLALLIYFRDWITEWVSGEAEEVRGDADDYDAGGF
jgi:Flp pilus assembly pilin Flp